VCIRGYIYRSPPPACQFTGGVPPLPARSGGEDRPPGTAAGPVLMAKIIEIKSKLAQLGAALETGLADKCRLQLVPSELADPPSTPLLGEAGGGLGQLYPSLPGQSAIRPTRGGDRGPRLGGSRAGLQQRPS
jgi:hypothetical protein